MWYLINSWKSLPEYPQAPRKNSTPPFTLLPLKNSKSSSSPPLFCQHWKFFSHLPSLAESAWGGDDIVHGDRVSTKVLHCFRNFVINCIRYFRSLMKHVSVELLETKHVFQNPYLLLKIYLHNSFWRHNLQSGPHADPDLQKKKTSNLRKWSLYQNSMYELKTQFCTKIYLYKSVNKCVRVLISNMAMAWYFA